MSRSSDEIARLLAALHSGARPIAAMLGKEDLPFRTQLLYVDPNRHYVIVAAPEDKAVAAALFSRPRLNFISEFDGWHIEFPVADPQKGTLAGKAAVRFKFPEVIVTHQRRVDLRVSVPSMAPLRCVADANGFAPFEGHIVDIAQGGIGFLLYSSDITLEPGTVLKGCHVDVHGKAPIVVDLEVRYSTPVTFADGKHAHRSGCVFLNPTREVMELIESFVETKGSAPKIPEILKPSEALKPPATLKPIEARKPAAAARPAEVPKTHPMPKPSDPPKASGAPRPSAAPTSTAAPRPPVAPKPSATPVPSAMPRRPETPKPSAAPKPSEKK